MSGYPGETSTCNIDIDGSGKVSGFELSSEETVIEKLLIALHGSGDVLHMGNPEIKSKISGSGTIRKADNN